MRCRGELSAAVPAPACAAVQVPDAARQHQTMIEAVENHMPEVVIVDEIGTEVRAEGGAARE